MKPKNIFLLTLLLICSMFLCAQKDSTAQIYIEQLNSPKESIRSNAAVQLYKLNHPQAIEACIKTINDLPDINHLDQTPSLECLIEIGKDALPSLAVLMLSDNEMTRLRASRAIATITFKNILKNPDTKDKHAEHEEWKKWWSTIGLDYEAGSTEREKGVRRLLDWLENE
jgi:hypothetical protein